MPLQIQVETLRAEREALAREAKAGNLADLRSAASRSRVEAGVKVLLLRVIQAVYFVGYVRCRCFAMTSILQLCKRLLCCRSLHFVSWKGT